MLLIGLKNPNLQTIDVDGVVNLGSVYRRYTKKGSCGLPTFFSDSNSITLNHKGIYHVTVVATVSAPATGDVTLQLLENDTPIVGALATETITTATTEFHTLTIDYYILVDSSFVLNSPSTIAKTIAIQNTGVEATISNIVVNIDKVL